MYEVKKLAATGGMARRLLAFGQICQLGFDEKLVELAGEDLVTKEQLSSLPMTLQSSEILALQHVRDWKGRAMLLDVGNEQARNVALANAALCGGRTLILAQPTFYNQWAQLIRDNFPDASICVFGNPRYSPKEVTYPQGISFKDKPDAEADFYITSYGGVIWHDFLGSHEIDQTVIEEMDHQHSVNYNWMDAVEAMFHEIPAPLFIQNIYNLPSDAGRDNLTSLSTSGSKPLEYIGQLVNKFLWAGIPTITGFTSMNPRDALDYLDKHGYVGVDMFKILNLFGVTDHLLNGVGRQPLTFHDYTIRELHSQKNRGHSALQKFSEREREMVAREGRRISQLVHYAVNGDKPSQTLIDTLKTTQWANLKAQHIRGIHPNMTNKTSRSLFLVENADLVRALKLQFANTIEVLADDPMFLTNRFTYPEAMVGFVTTAFKKLNNLIVTTDDLINHPVLMKYTNILVMADMPLDREMYEGIVALADQTGTQMVQCVIHDTFDQDIYNKLTEI